MSPHRPASLETETSFSKRRFCLSGGSLTSGARGLSSHVCARVRITHTIHSYTQTQELLLVRQRWKSEVPQLQGASGKTRSQPPSPTRRPGNPMACRRSHGSSQASQPSLTKTIRQHQRKSHGRLSTPFKRVGFPGGSDGKESACNAGDLGSILGLGRFPGEGNSYPLQYSCLENPHGQSR